MTTENLKIIRLQNEMTLEEVAKKLDITTTYYWLLENGKRKISYEMAVNISRIFNKTPDEIF